MLWIILIAILVIWMLGLVLKIAGGFIHLLLIVAAAILIYNLLFRRKTVV